MRSTRLGLRNIQLSEESGNLIALMGASGAGKSTLVKAIIGLLGVRSGKVSLRGSEITGLPTHELVGRGMGYVPQRANVFPSLSVEDNLRMRLTPDELPAVYDRFSVLLDDRPLTFAGKAQKKPLELLKALVAAPLAGATPWGGLQALTGRRVALCCRDARVER